MQQKKMQIEARRRVIILSYGDNILSNWSPKSQIYGKELQCW